MNQLQRPIKRFTVFTSPGNDVFKCTRDGRENSPADSREAVLHFPRFVCVFAGVDQFMRRGSGEGRVRCVFSRHRVKREKQSRSI